jgi:hypothetical protein
MKRSATEHALRPAEASEGGVGDGVGLQRLRGQVDMRVEIAAVGVEQGAVCDRARQVGREATAGRIGGIDRVDAAVVVEAEFVIDQEVVALACRCHVLVAVGAELDRPLQLLGGDGGECRKLVALGFLAAEAAAHAAHVDRDRVGWNVEHMADDMLDLARVLGRRPDGDVVILAGDGHGDVALEVEMLLATDPHLTLQPALGIGHLGLGFAALQRHRAGDQRAAIFKRAVDIAPVGRSRYSIFALRAARRAMSRLSAMTAKIGCWWNSTLVSASSGSSWLPLELTSLIPGTSLPVNTQMTPGVAATADRSMLTISAWARSERPSAPCSRSAGSGRSSI